MSSPQKTWVVKAIDKSVSQSVKLLVVPGDIEATYTDAPNPTEENDMTFGRE